MTTQLKLVVSVKQISYSGGHIGNDLTFGFDVKGKYTLLEQKIKAETTQVVDKVLWKSPVQEGDKLTLPISVVVTEQDLIQSDTGQGQTVFSFEIPKSGIKSHSFQMDVIERKKTATFSFLIEAAIKDFDYLRFDTTLPYMYRELIVNAQSKDVESIKNALLNGKTLLARTLWFSLVRSGAKWDHKPKLEKKLDLETPPDYYFPIRDDTEHEWYYDIWLNIHYGFVGRAAGFSAQTLQDYAASGLPGAGKNDDGDVLSVQIGIDLWDEYQLTLTQDQLHDAIVSHLQNYLDIQTANPDITVVIDWADGNLP